MRVVNVLSVVLLLAFAGAVRAHPDGATPVDHSLVVGFERFFAEGDAPRYLANGGILLIKSLGCVVCHEAPAAWAEVVRPEMAADRLADLGAGLDYPVLWLAIRNPSSLRNGSRMPEMFAHPDRNPEQVVALASFLYAQQAGSASERVSGGELPWRDGEVDEGRKLFHQIGCAACHAPEVPEGMEKPNVNSITLAASESADAPTVAGIIAGHREGSRKHPDLQLEPDEIRHLVAYLRMPGEAGPGVDPAVLAGEPDMDHVAEGEKLFHAMWCNSCHEAGREMTGESLSHPAPRLVDVAVGSGCIAEQPRQGSPFFKLSNLQRKALTLAIARISGDAGATNWSDSEAADLFLGSRNCYACHAWREKGGLEEARAVLIGKAGGTSAVPTLDSGREHWRGKQCSLRFDGKAGQTPRGQ